MTETYEFTVPVEIRTCPLCGGPMYAGGDIEIPGDPDFHEIAAAVNLEIAKREEQAIIEHYVARHRFRYWLFTKTGWKRLLG